MKINKFLQLKPVIFWLITFHFLIVAFHSAAHEILHVEASAAQLAFIFPVIIIAPVVAGFLLLKNKTAGALLLIVSMLGSFLFGLYYHFIAATHDHVSHVADLQPAIWAQVFELTAYLLAASEIAAVFAGMRFWGKAATTEKYAA